MLLIKNIITYKVLKYVAQIVLPAVGTLCFTVDQIWKIGHGTEVVGTIVAVDTFLGVVLHLSSTAYKSVEPTYAGIIEVTETDTVKNFSLNLDTDPDDLDKSEFVLFRVKKTKPTKKRTKAS